VRVRVRVRVRTADGEGAPGGFGRFAAPDEGGNLHKIGAREGAAEGE
jgi:hypothetical protein